MVRLVGGAILALEPLLDQLTACAPTSISKIVYRTTFGGTIGGFQLSTIFGKPSPATVAATPNRVSVRTRCDDGGFSGYLVEPDRAGIARFPRQWFLSG
jgi:hypothetical protein